MTVNLEKIKDQVCQKLPENLSYEEAVEEAQQLEFISLNLQVAQRLIDFRVGLIALHLDWNKGEKVETLKQFASDISSYYGRVATSMEVVKDFNENFDAYWNWIEDLQEEHGKTRFYFLQNRVRTDENPNVLGPEQYISRIAKRVERLGEDISRVNELQLEEEQKREAEGAISRAVEEIQEFQSETADKLLHEKEETIEDPDYEDFIRSLPCMSCKKETTEAAHAFSGGMGMKENSYVTIPLCRNCHQRQHNQGFKTFEEEQEWTYNQLCLNLILKYLTGRAVNLSIPDPLPF